MSRSPSENTPGKHVYTRVIGPTNNSVGEGQFVEGVEYQAVHDPGDLEVLREQMVLLKVSSSRN